MNVTCPECSSVFRVDPAKIPLAGVRARCSVCGGVIAIGERGRIDDDFTASTPAPPHTPARQRPAVAAPLPPRPPVTMPTPPQPMHAGFATQSAAVQEPPLRTSAPSSMPSRPQAVTPPQDRVVVPPPARTTPPRPPAAPPQAPAPAPATTSAPAAPAAPPAAPKPPATAAPAPQPPQSPQPPQPPRMSPFAPAPAPAASMPGAAAAPAQPAAPASAPVAPPRPAAPAAPAAPAQRPAASAGQPTARPPINPFLANDPNQKAKRLARALVSDIIAYFPDRHQQAKRDGVLRESFREEIKKSYEEYVEQMGKEFAENTTHFQDALNDVLAGGSKIF